MSGYEEVSGDEEVYVPVTLSYEYLEVPTSVVLSPSTVKPPPQAAVILIVTPPNGMSTGLPSVPFLDMLNKVGAELGVRAIYFQYYLEYQP